MKKIFLIIFVGSLFVLPLISLAATYKACPEDDIDPSTGQCSVTEKEVTYDGLVPCGKKLKIGDDPTPQFIPCQLCHFFIMGKRILDFVLVLVIVIAVLIFAIGGATFIFSQGNPSSISRGTSMMISAAWGLVIIFSAWIIVNTVLTLIGVADWTGLKEGWFLIKCPIALPKKTLTP